MNETIPARQAAFRVLVVDDEQFSLHVVAQQLSGLGAPHVVTAASVGEAHAAMAADPSLSLVISDHYMPERSGILLLGDLRQGRLPLAHDAHFIIATTSNSFALSAVALALDVDSFLTKPFSAEDLARRLYVSLVAGTRSIRPVEYYLDIDVAAMVQAAERLDPVARRVAKPAPAPAPAPVPMRRLGYVLPDTPLAADLLVKDGTVLLQKGTVLTRHLIARLTELGVETVPVGQRPH